ncbi:conserved hypothetical protein [Photobacterium profundum SS9]|uniref:Uncharacterized protein n=1 Tax=Photobacterium profundum (strain SS9) TaxID=298386 RepID=Q6LS13_PHOPR|nr:conserved hypothetical protein [Photobacterium profundum SS9]
MSKKYIELPVKDWPNFEMSWDLTASAQHFSDDGISQDDFSLAYKEPLLIAWVKMHELDNALYGHSIRKKEEIWSIGCKDKVAKVIAYCVENKQMTPAHIQPHKSLNAITIIGGNHRLAVCRALELEIIPVLIERIYENDLKNIINVDRVEEAI